eukprot:6211188-Pleurochrysis_carterae.AAC.2
MSRPLVSAGRACRDVPDVALLPVPDSLPPGYASGGHRAARRKEAGCAQPGHIASTSTLDALAKSADTSSCRSTSAH